MSNVVAAGFTDNRENVTVRFQAVVCAIVKDEVPANLDEWITFHNAQGFHIALYDHHSRNPVKVRRRLSMDVVHNWPSEELQHGRCLNTSGSTSRKRACRSLTQCLEQQTDVTKVSHLPCQTAAYDDCYSRYAHRSEWIGTWDPDEFMYPCPNRLRKNVTQATRQQMPSVITLANRLGVSAVQFMPVRFGPRSNYATGRLRRHLWRAPYAHLHEAVRCPVEELHGLTDEDKAMANLSKICEAETAYKWLSRTTSLMSTAAVAHPIDIHDHRHRKGPRSIHWWHAVRYFCCNHYSYVSAEQIARKGRYRTLEGGEFVARTRLADVGLFNSSWFSVYDDTILQWLHQAPTNRTNHEPTFERLDAAEEEDDEGKRGTGG